MAFSLRERFFFSKLGWFPGFRTMEPRFVPGTNPVCPWDLPGDKGWPKKVYARNTYVLFFTRYLRSFQEFASARLTVVAQKPISQPRPPEGRKEGKAKMKERERNGKERERKREKGRARERKSISQPRPLPVHCLRQVDEFLTLGGVDEAASTRMRRLPPHLQVLHACPGQAHSRGSSSWPKILHTEKLYTPPPPLPPFLAKRHFSEEGGGGVHFEAPRGRILFPPLLYTPHP